MDDGRDFETRIPIDESLEFLPKKKSSLSQQLDTKIWRKIFLVMIASSVMMDPLYLYVPVIDPDKRCLDRSIKLQVFATVVRTVLDATYAAFMSFQLFSNLRSSTSHVDDSKSQRSRRLLPRFIVVLAILPLPQIAVWMVAPLMDGSTFFNTKTLVKITLLSQFLPRLWLVYSLNKRFDSVSPTRKSKTAVIINLFLYIYTGHVIGATWYLLSVESFFVCTHKKQFCDDVLSLSKLSCSPTFDSGLYKDAFTSRIYESKSTSLRVMYCFWWAIQNISSLGQNLKPAKDVGEILFAFLIFACGLMLIILVIGLLQTRLLSETISSEEIKNKWVKVERWMTRQGLPDNIKLRIREHEQHKLHETRGINVGEFLNSIPKDLGRATKRHLGLSFLYKVPMFEKLERPVLDAICDRLRPVLYTKQRYIMREGSLVDEMVFFTRGQLIWTTDVVGVAGQTYGVLKAGDFCGEELLFWSIEYNSKSYPIATKTVQTMTNVEGFSLQPEDLKFVFTHFRVLRGSLFAQNFRHYSHQWRVWAACYIQVAWRRRYRRNS